MNLLHLLAALLVITTLAFAPRAKAAVTVTPTVEGLSGGTYKPLTMPSLTGNNFAATGRVLVNGKWINIPGYIPPASTAAATAKSSFWANPWIAAIGLLAWADEAGISSDQVASQWLLTYELEQTPGTGNATCRVGAGSIYSGNTYDAACAAALMALGNVCPNWHPSTGNCRHGPYGYNGAGKATSYQDHYCSVTECVGGKTYGQLVTANTYQETAATVGGTEEGEGGTATRPATLADFQAMRDPTSAELAELAPLVGVPVDAPVFEPVTVEIGDPYTKPDGSTWQQEATITPQPNGQVIVDTFERPVTDPNGDPVVDDDPVDTPEQQPTQCDLYPESLGCANLDLQPDGELETEDRDINLIEPVDLGGSGQCPAPLTANVLGTTVEMSFDPLCQYANTLRPLVLLLAWLSAGMIFIGGVRNG